MIKKIFILIKLLNIKFFIEALKFFIKTLVKISEFLIFFKNIINLFLLSNLEKKLLKSKNKFKNLFKDKNFNGYLEKGDYESQNKHIVKESYSSWQSLNLQSILITLDLKSDRCKSTLSKLKTLNINPDIFLAKTPNDLNKFIASNHIISDSKPVQIACFLSHLLAIKNALNKFDDEFFLILEDDIVLFPDPILVGLKNAIDNKDWEILQLEHNNPTTFQRSINLYNKGVLLHRWHPLDTGCGSYLIRRKFAESLINYFFENQKLDLKKCYQIDGEIASDQIFYDIAKTLVFTFPISYQDLDFTSQIGYEFSIMKFRRDSLELVKNLWKKYI